jgi:ELWxxDGT repeat protein
VGGRAPTEESRELQMKPRQKRLALIVGGVAVLGVASWLILSAFNDNLVFRADDGVNGMELWMTDGSAGGTRMVKDINPGSTGGWPQQMTLYNGKLYFAANDGTHDYELWVSDGTGAGTLYPPAGRSLPVTP